MRVTPVVIATCRFAVASERMAVPFSVARAAGGDLLSGAAGDWLMQYAPGDYGIVAQDRFVSVYRVLGENTSCGT